MTESREIRHNFEFLVLEHRPDNEFDGPESRVLVCRSFSKNGMLLEGIPRFDMFDVTLSMPQDGTKVEATVEVVSGDSKTFGVKFINPSKELLHKMAWWSEPEITNSSPSQSVDIGV